jgi:hypothetical protein
MLEFVQNAFDASMERIRLAPRPVVHHAILPVYIRIVGTSSQLFTQKEIADASIP